MDDALPFPIGSLIDGRYRIAAVLGQGGMGAVYRAEQVSLQREVALKVLRADLAGAEAAARFAREALALSKLDHPNIVRVIDSGQAEGKPYLVMELVGGRDLLQELYRGPMSPERAVPVLGQLCDALSAAHAQGIIHRDLKPENVILTEQGVPKILDFGIAVAADGSSRVTATGFVLGTPEYLAPEQAMGQPLTPRSDLYTLGVVAYRMLAGQLPFHCDEPREYLVLHAGTPCPPLADVWPAGGEWPELCAAVMKALHKDPAQRYPDALAMKQALEAGLAHRAASPGTATRPLARPAERSSKNRRRFGAAFGGPSAASSAESDFSTSFETSRTAASALAVSTQNIAVIFAQVTDWEDRSVRLTPQAASELQARFDALVTPIIKRFKGRKVKAAGGTLIFTVPMPTQAVQAAMAIHDGLWAHDRARWAEDQGAPRDRLGARVAVSLGELTLRDGDVFGEPVNIAARVLDHAGPDEVIFTDAVYLAMDRRDLLADPLGPQQLRGIPHAVRLFRLRKASVPELPPYGTRAPRLTEQMSQVLAPAGRALEPAARGAEALARKVGLRGRRTLGIAAALAVAVLAVGALALVRATRRGASNPDAAVLAQVEQALAAGHPERAQALLEPVLAEANPAPHARALAGRVAIARGAWGKGLDALRDAAKADPALRGELVNACVQALAQSGRRRCPVRLQAITLLAVFEAEEARTALTQLASSRACGHAEARAALKSLPSN